MTTGRAFERLINFTDAVVAVAITLLVLSITDITDDSPNATVWSIVNAHANELTTFAFTFFVVAAMWMIHNRTFNGMRGFDSTIVALNFAWLIGIVLLPWTSELYGEGVGVANSDWSGGEGLGGAGLLYWCSLAAIVLLAGLLARHLGRHPELLDPNVAQAPRRPARSLAFAALFLVIGTVSLFAPALSSWLPLAIIPLGLWFGRQDRKARPSTTGNVGQFEH